MEKKIFLDYYYYYYLLLVQHLRFNPLNTELNLICHLLALLGAHHILHVSRIRVKEFYFSIDL